LDLEWAPHVALLGDLLCVATSTGSLEFFTFNSTTARLEKHSSKQITEDSTLVLDLLWHPGRADVIAVTLSDGAVSLCQSSDTNNSNSNPWSHSSTVTTTELATHSLEPWTLAFSPDAELLFSGGDDAVLQALKLPPIDAVSNDRSEDDEDATAATLLWTDRKSHEAGVTAILPLANDLLITGSYDDRIRLLSAPAVGRRKVLAELDLGGGVWRLKTLGSNDERYVMSFFSLVFLTVFSVHPSFFSLVGRMQSDGHGSVRLLKQSHVFQ
jgi:diphthamide biosynthesis protein 7